MKKLQAHTKYANKITTIDLYQWFKTRGRKPLAEIEWLTETEKMDLIQQIVWIKSLNNTSSKDTSSELTSLKRIFKWILS